MTFTYEESEIPKRFVSIYQHWHDRPGEQLTVPDGLMALNHEEFDELRAKTRALSVDDPTRRSFEYWSEWRDMGGPHILRHGEHLGFLPEHLYKEINRVHYSTKVAIPLVIFIPYIVLIVGLSGV